MVMAFILNPPEKRKSATRKSRKGVQMARKVKRRNPKGKIKRSSKRGVKWRKYVKEYGVQEAAKRWRKLKRKPAPAGSKTKRKKRKVSKKKTTARKTTSRKRRVARKKATTSRKRKTTSRKRGMSKKARSEAAKKGWKTRKRRESMARKTKSRRKKRRSSSRKSKRGATSYRALVKKHGVKDAAKMWRKSGSKKRKYAANPARKRRRRKTTSKRRKRRTYARNEWSGQKWHHKIAAYAGWARRKGRSVQAYLRSKGVPERYIRGYVKGHGPVMSHKRSYTKTYPVSSRVKRYAANPAGVVASIKATAMDALSMEGLKSAASVMGGMFGAILGGAIVNKVSGEKVTGGTKVAVGYAGNIGGSILMGVGIGYLAKDRTKGMLAVTGGIAYTFFKLAYTKVRDLLPDNSIFGVELPALAEFNMSDYVEFPTGVGQFTPAEELSDYVEFPTGVSEFTPAEELGYGDEYSYDVEY